MTCIIGYVDEKGVTIGGDSAGVSGLNISIRNDEKVFKNGNMIFGCTSSFRMINLLRYKLKIPEHKTLQYFDGKSDYEYLCTDFIDAVIKCFKDNGYATIKSNEVSGGTFLFGYKGKLYEVDSDFQVAENDSCFNSCGCGVYYALGAMKILEEICSTGMTPKDKIKEALDVVCHFSGGVRPPYNFVRLTNE